MPAPARGHGALGLRSGVRRFSELDALSAVTRHTYLEMYAGQIVEGAWTATGSGAYSIPYNEVFDGRPQDAVGVLVLIAGQVYTLTRVETQALCDSTAATWFWDNDAWVPNPGGVDDPDFGADLELGVDDGAELYVHLPSNVDPNTVDVVALTIFGYWTGSKENPALYVQPILGARIEVDGGFEVWTTPTSPTHWTGQLSAKGAGSLNRDSALEDDGGAYSCRIDTTGAPGGTVGARQIITLQAGKVYRFSGPYKTQAGSTVPARLVLPAAGANPVSEDGRNLVTTGPNLDFTHGEVRGFSFDAIWPTGGTQIEFQASNPGGVTGSVWWDGLEIRRVYGYRFFEARLTAQGIPDYTQSGGDVFPGSDEGGGGQIILANDETEAVPGIVGYLEGMLSRWSVGNQLVVLRHGGLFPDGQEILWENLKIGASGLVRSWGCNDQGASFAFE